MFTQTFVLLDDQLCFIIDEVRDAVSNWEVFCGSQHMHGL